MKTGVSRVACMRLLGGVQVALKPARAVIRVRLPRSSEHRSPLSYRRLTPGITRRAQVVKELESRRVRGRVHAVVRLRDIFSPSPAIPQAGAASRPALCLPLSAAIEVR